MQGAVWSSRTGASQLGRLWPGADVLCSLTTPSPPRPHGLTGSHHCTETAKVAKQRGVGLAAEMSKAVTERGLWGGALWAQHPHHFPRSPDSQSAPHGYLMTVSCLLGPRSCAAGASSQTGCESGLWHLWGDHDGEVAKNPPHTQPECLTSQCCQPPDPDVQMSMCACVCMCVCVSSQAQVLRGAGWGKPMPCQLWTEFPGPTSSTS